MTDKNNKVERIWHDPPMPGETPKINEVTLGAGVPDEIRRYIIALETTDKIVRAISAISLCICFTVSYAVLITIPTITQQDILQFFILATIINAIIAVVQYYIT
jgi:hypothetical protein